MWRSGSYELYVLTNITASSTLLKVNEYSFKKADSRTYTHPSIYEYKVCTNIPSNIFLKITFESSINFSFNLKLIEKIGAI